MNTMIPSNSPQCPSRRSRWLSGSFAAIALSAVAPLQAQVFSGTFDLAGDGNNVTSFAYNGTPITGLTVSPLTKVGITSSSSFGNFRGSNWPTGASNGSDTFTGAVDTGKHIEFTLTATSGTIDLPTITFGVGRSSTGPRQWQWRSSADGYAAPIPVTTVNADFTHSAGMLTNPDSSSSWTGNVIETSGPAYEGLTSITFRLYGYNAEASTGTGGLQGNLIFGGTLSGGAPDTDPPVLVATSPADDAAGVSPDASLSITFDESVQAGTGFITLYDSGDNAVESFDVATASITGTAVTVTPAAALSPLTSYYVLIENGAITDTAASPNAYAGISDPTIWNFTTGDGLVPVLVINEVMQDPSAVGDSAGEWFEIYNPGASAVDINGWTISDNGTDSHVINNAGPLEVPAGGYLVLGNNSDFATNGGVNVAYSYGSSFFLSNNDDELVLTDSFANEIDRIEWDGGTLWPDPTGASMALSDPALDNNDGSNWFEEATFRYGAGDFGTPGGPNVSGGGAPLVASLSPVNGATGLSAMAITELEAVFSEDVTAGTGTIVLRDASDDSVVASYDVANSFDFAIAGNTLILFNVALADSTSYWVEIPDTAILALDDSTPFAGFADSTGWRFSTAAPPVAPTVVVNKYDASGPPDTIELLVIGDETPGSTLDMRGMILKDFSSNMTGDGGGKFEFSTDTLWEAVPVGTQIILTSDSTAADDIDPAGDFIIDIGLDNTTYFTDLGGSFNLANIEMVMIKEAGSGAGGTTGGIHALAGGGPGSFYDNFAGNKTFAVAGGTGVVALNPNGTIADFSGEGFDAEGEQTLSASAFGNPNNGTNAAFIAALRGSNPADGDGSATLVNVTVGSPFENLGFFDDGQTGRSARITLLATVPSVTLTNIEIEVPTADLGTIAPADVSVGGVGGAGASVSVSGSTIAVSNAAVTTTDAIEITIAGLDTPVPAGLSADGNYQFAISTTDSTGTLAPIASNPAAIVLIPIASLRDVDVDGIALDLGKTVAVEGVCTEEDFGNTGLSNFSAFIQDATAGINIFSAVDDPAFVRGNRYAVLGTVGQFNGLTEIVPASGGDIVDLGADSEPVPVTLSVTDLLAAPETYEGSLVTVLNLSYVSGTWGAGQSVTLEDSGSNAITIRIQGGSTATTAPSFPANVTGVFGQFDSSNPRTSGYQLMPRDPADLVSATGPGSDFADWAADNGIPGEAFGDDFDLDGISNGLEYAIAGLNPTQPDAAPGTFAAGVLSFDKRPEAVTNGDVIWKIEESNDLGIADPWEVVVADVDDDNTISYTLPTGLGKVFARLKVSEAAPQEE
ncbi:MAG: Ig-like domain-containing protein [Luteolibacter sp.]